MTNLSTDWRHCLIWCFPRNVRVASVQATYPTRAMHQMCLIWMTRDPLHDTTLTHRQHQDRVTVARSIGVAQKHRSFVRSFAPVDIHRTWMAIDRWSRRRYGINTHRRTHGRRLLKSISSCLCRVATPLTSVVGLFVGRQVTNTKVPNPLGSVRVRLAWPRNLIAKTKTLSNPTLNLCSLCSPIGEKFSVFSVDRLC